MFPLVLMHKYFAIYLTYKWILFANYFSSNIQPFEHAQTVQHHADDPLSSYLNMLKGEGRVAWGDFNSTALVLADFDTKLKVLKVIFPV